LILLTNLIYLFDYDFRNEQQVLDTLPGGARSFRARSVRTIM